MRSTTSISGVTTAPSYSVDRPVPRRRASSRARDVVSARRGGTAAVERSASGACERDPWRSRRCGSALQVPAGDIGPGGSSCKTSGGHGHDTDRAASEVALVQNQVLLGFSFGVLVISVPTSVIANWRTSESTWASAAGRRVAGFRRARIWKFCWSVACNQSGPLTNGACIERGARKSGATGASAEVPVNS